MKGRYQRESEICKVATLLFWVLIFGSCSIRVLKIEARRVLSSVEKEIEAKLKLINKPPVKTIQSEDGDIIDCINIYEQPAFDHPSLKNHTIKEIPNFLRGSQNSSTTDASNTPFQTWQKSGSCPEGTVPIRRVLKDDLLRASSIDRFGMIPLSMDSTNVSSILSYNLYSRSGAHMATSGFNYIGANADINVWNPKIDLPDDFTTAQIWVKAGNAFNFESVEAGWMVNPKFYGNRDTRLFIAWTKDSYTTTGCFDHSCPGFVQTSTQVALGARIVPLSSDSGDQYMYNFGIYKDDKGNWWLNIKHDVTLGYWPAELFVSLNHHAGLIQWGGQVCSSQVKKSPHTGTGMGSGAFPDGKYGHACFIRNMRIKDYTLQIKFPDPIKVESQEPDCYNALIDENNDLYFGGPGRMAPNCP